MTAARTGQAVILCFPVLVGETPLGLDKSSTLQTPKRGIQSAFLNQEGFVTLATNQARDGVAMERTPDEGFKDEDIEGTSEKFETCFLHAEVLPYGFHRENPTFPLVAQGVNSGWIIGS